MNWHPYPRDPQLHWCEHEDLVLNAHENGSWSVYSRTSRAEARNSTLAPIVGPHGLEVAKAAAENAAKQMLDA